MDVEELAATAVDATAILLAGSRPGETFAGTAAPKALVKVAGQPMLSRVARTLLETPSIGRVIIVAQQPEKLLAMGGMAALAKDPRVELHDGGASVSGAVLAAIDARPGAWPAFVTTADHPLLTPAMTEYFLAESAHGGADLAVGLVERAVLEKRFPDSRRTWLKFRGGAYSGANLFYLRNGRARAAVAFWRGIEQQRKKGRAVVGAFGPLLLAGVALRLLTLDRALMLAGKRLGLMAKAVEMPMAEACMDVDTPADLAQAEALLRAR